MNVDYIALAVPVFFILIGIELAYVFYKNLSYFRFNDSISNLSQGIGSQVVGLFMKTILFFGYQYIFENWRLVNLPNDFWVWIILFLGVDFCYYWFHRMSHQVNALWAAHIVHHQSEEYNLTVALRQSWFQSWFSWIFYLPLAFIGFDPLMFIVLSSFNTLYQFWIHTRTIKSLGFLEHILNTPAHHRVHHGSNPKYIDKNHAGTLIIWDKLSGTFQQEQEEVVYGITTPLSSWNPIWANLHYWASLWQRTRSVKGLVGKFDVFLRSPGSFGTDNETLKAAPGTFHNVGLKYNETASKGTLYYLSFQFLVTLSIASALLFLHAKMQTNLVVSIAFLVIASLVSFGAILENKKWVKSYEMGRLLLSFGLLYLGRDIVFSSFIALTFIFVQTVSLVWFIYLMLKQNAQQTPSV